MWVVIARLSDLVREVKVSLGSARVMSPVNGESDPGRLYINRRSNRSYLPCSRTNVRTTNGNPSIADVGRIDNRGLVESLAEGKDNRVSCAIIDRCKVDGSQ